MTVARIFGFGNGGAGLQEAAIVITHHILVRREVASRQEYSLRGVVFYVLATLVLADD